MSMKRSQKAQRNIHCGKAPRSSRVHCSLWCVSMPSQQGLQHPEVDHPGHQVKQYNATKGKDPQERFREATELQSREGVDNCQLDFRDAGSTPAAEVKKAREVIGEDFKVSNGWIQKSFKQHYFTLCTKTSLSQYLLQNLEERLTLHIPL